MMQGKNLQNIFCCFSPFCGHALAWGPGGPADFVVHVPRVVHGKVDLGHTDLRGCAAGRMAADKRPYCFFKVFDFRYLL